MFSSWLGFLLCPSSTAFTWVCTGSLTSVVSASFWYADGLFCEDGSCVMQEITLDDHNDPSDMISYESPPQMQASLIIVLIWTEKKGQMANMNLQKAILFSL